VVIVVGDINDFEFSTTADILVGSGRTSLIDLPRTLPANERYSYVFEGNSQILDQILMSRNLQPASSYDVVHMNAEFPDQISDHDPQVVRVIPLPSWYR
jgi:predicted extracellular nuclease